MKKLISLILPVCFLFQITLMAQDNSPQLTLEDLIPGGKNFYKYRIAYPRQIQWAGDTPIYVKSDSIMSISLQEKGSEKLIFDKIALNEVIPDNEKIRSLGVVSFPYISKTIARIQNNYNTYLYDYNSHTLISSYKLPSNAHNIDFSETNEHVAYTSENNLYVMNSKGKVTTVTTDTDSEIVNGQAVHRNEFGINKGTFWSPKGNFLAFYRMDETMVTDYPLVDVSTRIAELKNTKYPMAGMKSHQVTVGIFDPETGKTIFLKTGSPKEKYLTNLAWGPDESSIYIAELNRGQDTCSLVKYNITSGKKELILFTETHPKYVEPENPILFLPNAKESFLWQSKRDGHNHLYIYNTSGKLKKQLTTGDWDVLNILGFDENAKNIFITSTEESPIEKHIYKVNISNGARTRITDQEGVHQAILSRSGKYIIDIYSSQYNPGKIVLREISSNKKKTFFTAKNPYKKINLPEIQLGKIKASDQKTDLYYRLIKPINFNPDKKYPVIVYVYGGPHSQLVDNSWLAQARGWDIFMAEKGYVVFTLDNRGTNNRGLDFENVTHRQLGVTETEDQMMGIEFLKSCTFVDTDRIGVHGWSFGGFMTLNLVLRHPETFKVGVAGGPVTDWKYYEIMYGERYMDTPKENKEGYLNTSMVERAGDLKGRLMLIHGDEDPTVVMQHSLQFLKSAIQKGTHPDFFVYPGHGHNMIGKDRVHLHEHITRYFEDFL